MTRDQDGRLSFHPNHKRIASGALVIGVLTFVAKLFGAGREMAIAWRFGVSGTVDAYQLALTATTWIPMMLAGAGSAVLVPRLVGLQRDLSSRIRFLAELNAAVLAVALAVGGLTWFVGPLAAELLASHQSASALQVTASMSAAMAPVAAFMIGSAYFSARLQARERFGYSVTEAAPALAIILSLVLLPDSNEKTLVLGTGVGFLLQLVVLAAMTRHSDAPVCTVRWRHRSREWDTLRASFALMIAGQLLITASIPVDQGFASRLGEGSVAMLGYANRVITLISGLGTIMIGRALLPVLSESVASGNGELSRRHSRQWALFLGASAAVAALILWASAPLVVRIIFQRGAFSAVASAEVARVLRVGLIQLPFYFPGIALVQWYAATGRFRSILWISLVALIVKVILNAALAPRFGLSGIMMSTAAMYLLTTCLLLAGAGRIVDKAPVLSEE